MLRSREFHTFQSNSFCCRVCQRIDDHKFLHSAHMSMNARSRFSAKYVTKCHANECGLTVPLTHPLTTLNFLNCLVLDREQRLADIANLRIIYIGLLVRNKLALRSVQVHSLLLATFFRRSCFLFFLPISRIHIFVSRDQNTYKPCMEPINPQIDIL